MAMRREPIACGARGPAREERMYLVLVFLEAKPEHREAVRAALAIYRRACLDNEPGCVKFEIGVDPVDPASFLIYEVFRDEAAHKAHRELQHYSDYRLLLDPWTKSRRVLTYQLMDTADPHQPLS
jgi:autoinducer 2-degrading protein